jgi:hypothetical protein
MSLPSAYLTTSKNLKAILEALKGAQAPPKFTNSFLESLDFKSSSDRLVIGVLKALGFLDANGVPTPRYFQFLDDSQSKRVLAEGMKQAYQDLFQINTKAYELSGTQVKNKFKTLTQGKLSDGVLDKMAMTFKALVQLSDFSAEPTAADVEIPPAEQPQVEANQASGDASSKPKPTSQPAVALGGLVYNIQLLLPESRDPAVYEALFRSLKEHLLT